MEESDLKNLPGVGPATANKLKSGGYTTAETLSVTPPKEIAEKTGIGFNTVLNIVSAAREKIGLDFMTAEDLWKKARHVKVYYRIKKFRYPDGWWNRNSSYD